MGNTWNVGIFSKEHIEMANLVPLRTISTYFTRLEEHSIDTSIVVMNLSVNLLLLAPMAVFVKVLFSNKINRFCKVELVGLNKKLAKKTIKCYTKYIEPNVIHN